MGRTVVCVYPSSFAVIILAMLIGSNLAGDSSQYSHQRLYSYRGRNFLVGSSDRPVTVVVIFAPTGVIGTDGVLPL